MGSPRKASTASELRLLRRQRRRAQAVDGLVQRTAGQPRRVLDRVDAVLVLLVGAEDQAVASHRDRRAERGDPADAGDEVGDLRRAPARDVEAVDVRDPVAVGDEEQAGAVGRPLGVDVLAFLEAGQRADVAGGRVHRGQAVVADGQAFEPRREAVGDEGDRAAVGRPRGLQVGKGVVGEPPQRAPPEVVDEQVGDAADDGGERDRLPVRREGGIGDLAQRARTGSRAPCARVAGSRMTSTGFPLRMPPNTNRRPLASQSPAELMNCRLS